MSCTFWEIMCVAVLAACVAGCVSGGHVIGGVREGIPRYSDERQMAAPNASVAIYPISDGGDSETRAMRDKSRDLLAENMKNAGYRIVSCSFSDVRSRTVGVVEVVDCHNMTEWSSGGVASLVTVVAVSVRRPGILADGHIACGRFRSFQGVSRTELGRKSHDFILSEEERTAGIREAVSNIMKIAQFKEAVEDCNRP
ncbi:MAG: hypothetical protein IJL17_05150 [Kiritimatiellae bacterium]|nr:hypothetical protein [Kiritimatiellia bacterium]